MTGHKPDRDVWQFVDELGRWIAEAFVREWGCVLKIGDTTKSHTADN